MKTISTGKTAVSGQTAEGNEQTAVSGIGIIDFKLYLITDRRLFDRASSFFTAIEETLRGGVRAIQLREKDLGIRALLAMAYRLRDLTREYNASLFINDRADVALAVGADGVHLGQRGIPASAAKKIPVSKLLVGVSTHSLAEALEAEREGADFVTLGPLYPTSSKLPFGEPLGMGVLREVRSVVRIPIFGIGGIIPDRVKEVTGSGAFGVAVISAILGSKNRKQSTEEFLRYLE